MDNFVLNGSVLNDKASITKLTIGRENTPLVIIDDFALNYHEFIDEADDGSLFVADAQNFYPGKRKLTKASYAEQICSKYLPLFKSYFGFENAHNVKAKISAFAISDMAPEQLRPMQTLPHFDTTHSNQFAVVHYLCESEHGGTSFYRHRASSFEVITAAWLVDYGTQLKRKLLLISYIKIPAT